VNPRWVKPNLHKEKEVSIASLKRIVLCYPKDTPEPIVRLICWSDALLYPLGLDHWFCTHVTVPVLLALEERRAR